MITDMILKFAYTIFDFIATLMPTLPTDKFQWDAIFGTFVYVNKVVDIRSVFDSFLLLTNIFVVNITIKLNQYLLRQARILK
jgi:hypothetical protein